MYELNCLITDPMKNDLVLERIFHFCDFHSLKNIRLVSIKWRNLSLKAWRRKAVFQLCCQQFEDFLKLIDSEDDNDSLQLRHRPFKRYSVTFKDTREGLVDFYDIQKRVAEKLASLRPFHLSIVWDSKYFRGFREYLQPMLNSNSVERLDVTWGALAFDAVWGSADLLTCSSLKRLNLLTRRAECQRLPEHNFWGYLLKSFPKIEALSLEGGNEGEGSHQPIFHLLERQEIATILKQLRMPLRELEMKTSVSHQYTDSYNEREIIRILAECTFPLERLSYHIPWNGEGEMPILPLLKSCKATLQYFETVISFDNSCIRSTGVILEPTSEHVTMEVLKELRIANRNGLKWGMFFLGQLDLPVLEKLVMKLDGNLHPYLNDTTNDLVSVTLPDWKSFERLKTLELHDMLHALEPEKIEKLARMMPNVAHLTIALDKSTFPVVCQHLRGLKTLNVLEAVGGAVDIDDESLTGLSKIQLAEGGAGSRAPNITDLQCLTDLYIDCKDQLRWDYVQFTEYSVIYGLLQLPRLYNLSIAIDELSEEMKEKLLNHAKGNVDIQVKPQPSPLQYFMHDNLEDPEWSDGSTTASRKTV